ncbi:MAG: MBL fold metallo-hydrolase [Rhizobiales bacterium]|nr:MBL fold metallo-hydrolase [Hyphomicrobiales bacterium]
MAHPHQWWFGETTMQRVVESETPLLPPFEFFPDCTQAHLDANRDWLQPRFQDAASGALIVAIQSFLIRQNGLTILIDSCSGNDKEARVRPAFRRAQWPWLRALNATGVKPEDIDIVLCSHLHVDHVGWNTRLDNGRWVPTFPNARYLIGRREFEYWKAAGPAALARSGDYISDSVLPVFESGQADLIGDEHGLAHDISVEPAPGHTPGQLMVRVGSGREQAILCADLMHHPLQIRYPEWSTVACADPAAARTTRIKFFNDHAGTGRLIFPAHFPTPTGGTIERDGKDFHFSFCGEQGKTLWSGTGL